LGGFGWLDRTGETKKRGGVYSLAVSISPLPATADRPRQRRPGIAATRARATAAVTVPGGGARTTASSFPGGELPPSETTRGHIPLTHGTQYTRKEGRGATHQQRAGGWADTKADGGVTGGRRGRKKRTAGVGLGSNFLGDGGQSGSTARGGGWPGSGSRRSETAAALGASRSRSQRGPRPGLPRVFDRRRQGRANLNLFFGAALNGATN
jgi:hypothetical protein